MKRLYQVAVPLVIAVAAWVGASYLLGFPGSGAETYPAERDPGGLKLAPDMAPSPQQAALADGLVTWEEYLAAVRANTNCIRSQGIPVSDAVVTGEKVTPGSAGPFASDAEMERATKVMQECNATYLNAVGLRWYLQNAPSEETFAAARAELAACLAAAGVAVGQKGDGAPDFTAAAQSDPKRFSLCSARVSEQFGIPNFAG